MSLNIAIVVHGRFHAFNLSLELLKRGHCVTVFTNYPKWAAARFGLDRQNVRSFWINGLLTRFASKLPGPPNRPRFESKLHRMFGRWAASEVRREHFDVVHPWSGVSEELLDVSPSVAPRVFLMRGSSHIRTQAEILEEEQRRANVPLDRPSVWKIAREEREYLKTHRIVLLSRFSYDSFVQRGFSRKKLRLLLAGADLRSFTPSPATVESRLTRILTNQPLRVLWVGSLCYRKGMFDMVPVVQELSRSGFDFRFVGPVLPEAAKSIAQLSGLATFAGKRPQERLVEDYAWADVFIQPTLEDGFQTVLSQAAASALPILTTPNGAGSDLVKEGHTGWIVPIRSPHMIIEKLHNANQKRTELAAIVRNMLINNRPRSWAAVAQEFERMCDNDLDEYRSETTV